MLSEVLDKMWHYTFMMGGHYGYHNYAKLWPAFWHKEAIHQQENSLYASVASPKLSRTRINQSVSAVKKSYIQGRRGSPSTAGKNDFSLTFDVSVRNAKCPKFVWPWSEHNTDPGRGREILIPAGAKI